MKNVFNFLLCSFFLLLQSKLTDLFALSRLSLPIYEIQYIFFRNKSIK